MRIPSGAVDLAINFVAVDSADHITRKTGLSAFAVYRSRNGGAATAYTTPTTAELSAANMPGVYTLLIDEDTTIGSTHDDEEYVVHITATGMDPVTRVLELYRPKITVGNTLAVDATGNVTGTVGSLGATAKTDVENAVWNGLRASHTTAGTFGQGVASVQGNVTGSVASVTGAVGSVTGAVGSVTGSVGSVAAGGISAASFAANAIDANAIATNGANEIADAVWNAATATHTVAGSFGLVVGSGASGPTAVSIAAAVWEETKAAHTTAGTFGFNLDVPISTRLAPTVAARTLDVSAGGEAGLDWANIGSPTTAQNLSATTISAAQAIASVASVGTVTGNVNGNVTGSVGSVAGSVGGNLVGSVGSLSAQAKSDTSTAVWGAGTRTLTQIDTGVFTPAAMNTLGDSYLDRADAIEVSVTPRQAMRLWTAVLGGKVTGGGTGAENFRNAVADSKNRIQALVDANGNRTSITYDLT